MSRYKMVQLTNKTIGAVAVNALVPLGTITRRVDCSNNASAFTVTSSNTDTITINEEGYYKVTYSISAVATDAGLATVTLVVNGIDTYTVGATATAGGTVNLTLPYEVRVFRRCNNVATNNPMTIQIKSGVALTSAVANIIVEKKY